MSKKTAAQIDRQIREMDAEQLPVGKHEQHGAPHFAGLYAAENVAGTEFIFGQPSSSSVPAWWTSSSAWPSATCSRC